MKPKQHNPKINRLYLWILFGFAWLTPQIIIRFLPVNLQFVKAIILALFGFVIIFNKNVDKLLIRKEKNETKN